MNYISDHIPRNTPFNRRPGTLITNLNSITIHNNANPTSTAKNERGWLTNPINKRDASFHIAVDENDAVEVIPTGLDIFPNTGPLEVAHHSANRIGNRESLSIEICELNFEKSMKNTVILVSKIMYLKNLQPVDVDRFIKKHSDWTNTDCPRLMNDTIWINFLNMIKEKLKELLNPSLDTKWDPEKAGLIALDFLVDDGIINSPDIWKDKMFKPVPTWLLFELLKRVINDKK